MVKGVGGGNFLILAPQRPTRRSPAAEAAADGDGSRIAGVILPFPGGVVRSGSKVGSRRIKSDDRVDQRRLLPYAPRRHPTALPETVNSVLEIVINGTDADAIARAMRLGIDAACRRRGRRHLGRQLRRQARPAPFPSAEDHGGRWGMSEGLDRPVEELPEAAGGLFRGARQLPGPHSPLTSSQCVRWSWRGTGTCRWATSSRSGEPAASPLYRRPAPGRPPGAGLSEGTVIVEGDLGNEAGLGMAAGGASRLQGDAGARTGAAAPGFKRGMTGGELSCEGRPGRSRCARCAAGCS